MLTPERKQNLTKEMYRVFFQQKYKFFIIIPNCFVDIIWFTEPIEEYLCVTTAFGVK